MKPGFSPSVLVFCSALIACKPDRPQAEPVQATSGVSPTAIDLAVLPNNVAVFSADRRLLALQNDNQVAWETKLPNDDVAIAPLAVALDSVTYVRGKKGLYAVLPDGKLGWQKPIDGRAHGSATLDAPVALSDSTVAISTGDDVLRFDHGGAIKWRFTVPEGHQTGRLSSAMDGSLLVPTSAGIYSINPDGNVSWRHPI
jgi:outer membrane protein assembly factor BamB